jgi:hypothetical protein
LGWVVNSFLCALKEREHPNERKKKRIFFMFKEVYLKTTENEN